MKKASREGGFFLLIHFFVHFFKNRCTAGQTMRAATVLTAPSIRRPGVEARPAATLA